jgi:hypothetical protein
VHEVGFHGKPRKVFSEKVSETLDGLAPDRRPGVYEWGGRRGVSWGGLRVRRERRLASREGAGVRYAGEAG